MKKLFFAFIASLACGLVTAQNFTHEFGKYSNEEFQMKTYSRDPKAEAVVIYDIGKSYFVVNVQERLELIFERRIKIKILNKAGIKYAEFAIPFYEEGDRFETVTKIEGNTYNYEDGRVRCTPLDLKNVFVEKNNKKWKTKKLAMPDVKEGSVIELKYTIESPFFFNFRSWEFQSRIPTIFSEYTTKMIPFYTYQYILQGINKLNDIKSYVDNGLETHFAGVSWKDVVYVFTLKDIPAFNDEAFISSPDDYIIKLDFQMSEYSDIYGSKTAVMTTWNKLVKDVLDEDTFGGYMKSSQSQAKNILDTMNMAMLTPYQKTEKVFNLIKLNFNWNGINSKFSNQKPKEFLKSKIGNSADINLFLIAMLRAAGLEANPLIISTRGNGKIKSNYPFQHFFNYVIAIVPIDSSFIALDATDPLCSVGMVPPRCINDKGLYIKKGKDIEWLTISSRTASSKIYNIGIIPKLDADSLLGNVKLISTGYDALNLRRQYFRSPSSLKSSIISSNHTLIDSIKVFNLSNIKEPFTVSLKAQTSIENVDGKLIIEPFFGIPISENPLKQVTRVYTIDMTYHFKNVFESTIQIPEGYKLISKPQNLSIDNSDVTINYQIIDSDDKIIRVSGVYEFKKDSYPPTNYSELKNYFKTIIEKFNEKIILVKI